nr:hypothetical protein [Vulcanisaeta sp. JCM 14467]
MARTLIEEVREGRVPDEVRVVARREGVNEGSSPGGLRRVRRYSLGILSRRIGLPRLALGWRLRSTSTLARRVRLLT